MQILIVKRNKQGDLIPDNEYERKIILDTLKLDKPYQCKVSHPRNIKSLAKYWILMKALEFHFDQPDIAYHMYFKELFLEPIVLKLKDGTVKKYPNSIAFDKMNQLEFNEYFSKISQWLESKDLNVDELINTAET